jgi:hypothetical protein
MAISSAKNLWAVLIGIEQYPEEELPGPGQDVHNMRKYFLDQGANPDRIKLLMNEEATRTAILDVWNRHLVENDQIKHGEPILLYYSGHGGRLEAPLGWSADGPDSQIELLVPYDSLDTDGSVAEDFAIPDRTIGAVIRKIARRHGNNITVIFDCCYSAHMTRAIHRLPPELRFAKRGLDTRRLKTLTPTLDQDIWGAADAQTSETNLVQYRGAYFHRQNDTHVMLAACTRNEESNGNAQGGLFTRALLKSLEETEDISYDRLLQRIDYHFHSLRNAALHAIDEYATHHKIIIPPDQRPGLQTPQCEGTDRSRLLWRTGHDTVKSFTVQPYESAPDGPRRCQIHVGTAGGVKVGTVFQLNEVVKGGHDTNLASVIATEVTPTWCFANLPPDVTISSESVRAVITTLGGPLKYFIENREPASSEAVRNANTFRKSITIPIDMYNNQKTRASAVIAQSVQAADVIITVA